METTSNFVAAIEIALGSKEKLIFMYLDKRVD